MAYRSGFYTQFARKLRVMDFLRGRRSPIGLEDLARRVDIHPRTMRTDLKDIQAAGNTIELSYDEDDAGKTLVRLVSKSYMDVPITRGEAHTFAGTRRLWEPFRGTPLHDDMENLFTKIMERLPAAERREVEEDRERFFFIPDGGVKSYTGAGKREIVRALQVAVMSRHVVKYRYRTARGQVRSGLMAPYSLGVHRNGIYVLARLVRKTERRRAGATRPPLEWARWPVERFEAVDYQPKMKFSVPADFKVDEHFDDWGIVAGETRERVVVEFSAAKAPYIRERVWHRTQTVEALEGGRVRLSFDTANLVEVQQWVLSWGSHALVIAPTRLRESVLAELDAAVTALRRSPTVSMGPADHARGSSWSSSQGENPAGE